MGEEAVKASDVQSLQKGWEIELGEPLSICLQAEMTRLAPDGRNTTRTEEVASCNGPPAGTQNPSRKLVLVGCSFISPKLRRYPSSRSLTLFDTTMGMN